MKKAAKTKMGLAEIDETFSREQSAIDKFLSRGLDLPTKPKLDPEWSDRDSPKMPTRLSPLRDAELGDLQTYFTAWHGFARAELARAKINLDGAKKRAEKTVAFVRLTMSGTAGERNDNTAIDRRCATAEADHLEAQHVYDLVNALVDQFDKDLRTISRQVAIRENKIKLGGRSEYVGSHTQPRSFGAKPKVRSKSSPTAGRPSLRDSTSGRRRRR